MRLREQLLSCTALILLWSQLVGCSGVYVAGISNPSNVTVTTGSVSAVRLTVISNSSGTFVNITAVTLLMPLGTSSLMLCGDQRSSFPMNSTVQVSYTPGQDCSNLVKAGPG